MILRNTLHPKPKLFEYYYFIILLIILIQLYIYPGVRLGVVSSIVILFVAFKTIKIVDITRSSILNKLVLGYLFYNTASVILYIYSEIPLSVYFAEWSNSILPISFFYMAHNSVNDDYKFYNNTLIVIIISFILGFYLWITEPPVYRVFMDTTEGPGTDMFFFESLYGLTATGALSVIGFLISTRIIASSSGKGGKLAMLICVIASLLTFRRSSMLALFISFLFMHYLLFWQYNFIKKRYFLLEAIFLISIYNYFVNDYSEFIDSILERGSMVTEAFSERSGTWGYAFQDFSVIFGKGLGSAGHKAIGFSKTLIPDGNYFKMISEIGILGSFLFISIIIAFVFLSIKEFINNYLEVGIVLSICLIGIGSNIFEYQSIAPIFWFSIGRISHNHINKYQLIQIKK